MKALWQSNLDMTTVSCDGQGLIYNLKSHNGVCATNDKEELWHHYIYWYVN